MSGRFGASIVIDRPVQEVFDFLAAGTNDPAFSPRITEIRQTSDGPVGVGTTFDSTAVDAGRPTKRTNVITAYEAPTTLRWAETSKNAVTGSEGGYDLEAVSETSTRLTFFNVLEGHGFGKLIAPLAVRLARKDQDGFVERIKAAVEKS
jgi:hypothetical protein